MHRLTSFLATGIITATVIVPVVAQTPVRGNSAVRGRVLDAGGQPLAGALVRRDGSNDSARAGSDGAFLLGQLALGRHAFTVSAPGYQEIAFEVEFSAIDTASVDIPLERGGNTPAGYASRPGGVPAMLDSVGFNARRANPPRSATFITPEDIAARAPTKLSDALHGIADLTLRLEPGNLMFAYGHDQRCRMNVWLDNSRLENVFPATTQTPSRRSSTAVRYTGLDEILPIGRIAAIEVYTRPSQVPTRFQGQGSSSAASRSTSMGGSDGSLGGDTENCGTIILWSK